ncbi:MAG: (2Fe-2S)-binding protein [Planctomycetes bacterium]|nr:(2Fe-2S)-binding protein [Planctomycetota bacterium]MBI3848195.1 (2Fe-2S)-binding protein [Planctomycetota bacterium]
MRDTISLQVNGKAQRVDVDPKRSLLFVIRDVLGFTGTKYGCGEAQCGACTVLVAGKATRSCVTPVAAVAGKAITTIEGLAPGGVLHPLQQAFIDCGAMQCGYCTTGMILSGVALLEQHPHPTPAEIVSEMDGNICRCGTYPRIVAAIQKAAAATKAGGR